MRLRLTNNVSFCLDFETNAKTFVKDINAALVEYRRRDELKRDPELQIAVPVPGEERIAWINPNYSEPKILLILDAHAVQEILKSRGLHLWKKVERAYEASLDFQAWFQSLMDDSSEDTVHGKPHLEVVRAGKQEKDDPV
jgi:hypothetical protein